MYDALAMFLQPLVARRCRCNDNGCPLHFRRGCRSESIFHFLEAIGMPNLEGFYAQYVGTVAACCCSRTSCVLYLQKHTQHNMRQSKQDYLLQVLLCLCNPFQNTA